MPYPPMTVGDMLSMFKVPTPLGRLLEAEAQIIVGRRYGTPTLVRSGREKLVALVASA